jgi:hypothetical protein
MRGYQKMAETKYGRYISRRPVEAGKFGPDFRMTGEQDFKSDFSLTVIRVSEPVLMEELAHSHDFDMYLFFLGFDPDNMGDLGAEIEMYFGEEGEKHIINSPTSVYIPKGQVHCPLNFKRVDKPILFIHATLAPKYKK